MRTILTDLPQHIRDLLKGLSMGLVVTFPLLVVWISFRHPETFTFAYMKEISLLAVWMVVCIHILPLKSLKVGKDKLEFDFSAEPVSPDKVIR